MTPQKLRWSLRMRLLAGTLVWIAASIAIAGWGLSSLFRQHVSQQFHAELRTHLDQLTAHISMDAQGRPVLARPMSDPRLERPYSGYYWQIDLLATDSEDGAQAPGQLRSRSLWDHVLQVPPDAPQDGEIHQHQVMGPQEKMLGMVERSVRLGNGSNGPSGTLRLIAAADEHFMEEPVARLNGTLWLALGVLGAGLVLAALVQVWVGLAPLRNLRTSLAKVRNGETQQLEGDFPVEIMPLIEEFNTVLGHNTAVVERARAHAGNLAHALKTPLTVLANAANAPGMKAETAELARLVNEQVGMARKHVDYHLSRAQAAAAHRIPGSKTPLQPVVDGLIRVMRRIHADRALQFTIETIPVSLDFRGEAQDLQEMLGNLLDNACKWAAQKIHLSVRIAPASFTLVIDDDGPGLTLEQTSAVMQRGVRADEKTPGSGLGLSIVDELARLYGGEVELGHSPLGGLRAVLTLPASIRIQTT